MSQQKPIKWDPVFDLNRDLLKLLGEEFHVSKPVDEFVRRVAGVEKENRDEIAEEVFGDYGTRLMQRTFELGEQYVDKAYEELKKLCSRPEVGPFPLIAQRFLEVAYLSFNQNLPS